ncbi:hypothetical protein BOTBODRAFT_139835 [Botryobasidium botryosum FD-172 SS1]|uniref:Protein kinase domain-containing protein n=1 Tax=Botryobasidium botryosum (strain FD-172 SS1) TaxID=930990 RepID=A0A067LWK7_BOTB1|nr:hypothetical protein BOTBODRAFT_139835 [Botryobasidium botryosum FD-172 SS1]
MESSTAIRISEMVTQMRQRMNALPESRRHWHQLALADIYEATGIYPCDEGLFSCEIVKGGNEAGQGGYSFCHRGTFLGRHDVVLKELKWYRSSKSTSRESVDDRRRLEREVAVWKSFNHPHVLRLIGCYTHNNKTYMVAPYMPKGNARTYIRKHSDLNCPKVLLQVAQGLEHIHGVGAVHGDICGNNVLIFDSGNACIADFGLSIMAERYPAEDYSSPWQEGGGVRWKAPELLHIVNNQYPLRTTQSDMFSFGRLIYELTTGRVPFAHIRDDHYAFNYIRDGGTLEMPQDDHARSRGLTRQMWALAQDCWAVDPNSRPTARETVWRLKSFGI